MICRIVTETGLPVHHMYTPLLQIIVTLSTLIRGLKILLKQYCADYTSCDTFHRNVVNQYISLPHSCRGVSTLSVGGKKGKGGMPGK